MESVVREYIRREVDRNARDRQRHWVDPLPPGVWVRCTTCRGLFEKRTAAQHYCSKECYSNRPRGHEKWKIAS